MNLNQEVFNHIAEFYDAHRPSPPAELPDLLTQLAQVTQPSLVVDLGSGTGLSTLLWQHRAQKTIGIEPNADMLTVARHKISSSSPAHQLSFQQGDASQTGLPDSCADIVTCSQSLHWMEPHSTLSEIARILRPGGVFAAYDYQWPPTLNWQAEQAYETFIDRAWEIKEQQGLEQDIHIWRENKQLSPLQACGHFRYVKEFWLHKLESGNAERFIGLTLSNGVIQYLQSGQLSADAIELPAFQQAVTASIGSEAQPWYFSYHVRIGIK